MPKNPATLTGDDYTIGINISLYHHLNKMMLIMLLWIGIALLNDAWINCSNVAMRPQFLHGYEYQYVPIALVQYVLI